MKKRSERRKHCALAVVSGATKFRPAADPLPGGGQDGQNVISWRWSLPSPTDPVWWRPMHAISSYRGNRPTNKQTNKHTHKHTQTHRQDRLQYTAPQLASAQCNENITTNNITAVTNKLTLMAVVCLSVCLSVRPSVRPSACPVPDSKSRMEGVASWRLAGRKSMTRVTRDPI